VLLGLHLESLQLAENLGGLLQRMLRVALFLALRKDQVLRDAREQLHHQSVVDVVKQLWLDFRREYHVELRHLPHQSLVRHRHLLLLRLNVLSVALDRTIRFQRLDLGVDGVEPLLEVKMRLGLQHERSRLVFDLQNVIGLVPILDVGGKLLDRGGGRITRVHANVCVAEDDTGKNLLLRAL